MSRSVRAWGTNSDSGRGRLCRHSLTIAFVCLAVIGFDAGRGHAATQVDIQYQITAASFTSNVGPTTWVVVAAVTFGGDFTLRSAGKRRQVSHRGRICPIY